MSRYSLEEINNMDADAMRQALRNAELEAMKADEEKAAELAKMTDEEKRKQAELDAFFRRDKFKQRMKSQGKLPKSKDDPKDSINYDTYSPFHLWKQYQKQ